MSPPGAAFLHSADRVEGPINLVFGRGGIRGIAMAGAAAALHRAGFDVDRAAGISVGGIIAALLMAGYKPDELRRLLLDFDFDAIRDAGPLGRVPLLGPAWRLFTRLGVYEGDILLSWLRDLLQRKGVRTFADLRVPGWHGYGSPYRLQVLCSDLTRARLVVLPDDAVDYGIDPDGLEVALALRMSASLPFIFRPLRLGPGTGSLVVDGGLVAGIPYRLFDCARGDQAAVTLGIQAGPGAMRRPSAIRGPLSLLRAGYYTALKANEGARDPVDVSRTIEIDCGPIGAIDFSLSDPQKQGLYDAGISAVDEYLTHRLRAVPGQSDGSAYVPASGALAAAASR